MIYEVKNRIDARGLTYEKIAPASVIISITDVNKEDNIFYPQNWLVDVLRLKFDDVTEGRKNCITYRQAKDIAKFICTYYNKVERIIVHCEYGQSRSAGVAAAISNYYEGHSNGIFGNKAYNPNQTCYQYVLEALRRIKVR